MSAVAAYTESDLSNLHANKGKSDLKKNNGRKTISNSRGRNSESTLGLLLRITLFIFFTLQREFFFFNKDF